MRPVIHAFFAAVALMVAGTASASSLAAPFGLAPGTATLADVQRQIGAHTKLREEGISALLDGKILSGNGAGLKLPELKHVLFVFDTHGVLQIVQLSLPNGGMGYPEFKQYRSQLSNKYRQLADSEPFVGEQYARFAASNAVISIDSPELSFDMDITYLTPIARAAIARDQKVKEAQRRASEAQGL